MSEREEMIEYHEEHDKSVRIFAEAKLQTLIDQEVKKARIDELSELNYQIAVRGWHKENAYKIYAYMLKRVAELEKDNK